MTSKLKVKLSKAEGGNKVRVKVGPGDPITLDHNDNSFLCWLGILKINNEDVLELCPKGYEDFHDYIYKNVQILSLNAKISLPSQLGENQVGEYYGVIILSGSWKYAIGRNDFDRLNSFFSLGLTYPNERENERTNFIGIWGSNEVDRCYLLKVDRNLSFSCDMDSMDSLFFQHTENCRHRLEIASLKKELESRGVMMQLSANNNSQKDVISWNCVPERAKSFEEQTNLCREFWTVSVDKMKFTFAKEGTYLIYARLMPIGSNSSLHLELYCNNQMPSIGYTTGFSTTSVSYCLDARVGDEVYVKTRGEKIYHSSTGHYCHMSIIKLK